MADVVSLASEKLYDPTAFTTIADLYAAVKNEQLVLFEREARANAAPGIGLLDAYLRTGNLEELTRLWDRSRELSNMTFDTLLVSSFGELLRRCYRLSELRQTGVNLARLITQDRMKLVYRLLSSSKSDAKIAALALLTAMNAQGSTITGELYANFNFSLNALRRIASQSKAQPKDDTSDKTFNKPSVLILTMAVLLERSHYVRFMLSFIQYGDIMVKRTIVSSKEFTTGVLSHLSMDTEEEIIETTLNTLKNHIVQDQRLPRSEVISIFTPSILEHVCL
ncbi:ribosome 60S biogenesis N-terminal-domain-containing protein [Syncephalis fuscata]|nr:ribosome 60S biogenesis N-terminal-domain-containing protein [Syncephalis fuscata]